MLTDFRNWLESELKLLGNASHHAYSFGQANMAKRALDRLDEEFAGAVAIVLPRAEARDAAAAFDALAAREPSALVALDALRGRLRAALEAGSHEADMPASTATERSLLEEPPVV